MKSDSPHFRGDPYQRLEQNRLLVLTHPDSTSKPVVLEAPSVRSQRKTAILVTLGLTLGCLIFVMYSPNRMEFLAPGPLATSHAQILRDQGTQRCATCHGAGAANLADWITDLFTRGQHLTASQSHLCLACHETTLDREFALFPHGLPPEQLQAITESKRPLSSIHQLVAAPTASEQLACAQCHREHHGAHVSLTSLSDAQCQSCHLRAFDSFQGSHPDFQLASRSLESRAIRFDHQSHAIRHFSQAKVDFDCRTCHQTIDGGNTFQRVAYESACAGCHDQSLTVAAGVGITVLNLPSIDRLRLEQDGVNVGVWPENSSHDFDGKLAPAIMLLLRANPELDRQIAARRGEVDFWEINVENPDDRRLAVNIVKEIQQLAHEIQLHGTKAMSNRWIRTQAEEARSANLPEPLASLPEAILLAFADSIIGTPGSGGASGGKRISPSPRVFSMIDDGLLAVNPLLEWRSRTAGSFATTPTIISEARPPESAQTIESNKDDQFGTDEGLPTGSERQRESGVAFPRPNRQGVELSINPLLNEFVHGEPAGAVRSIQPPPLRQSSGSEQVGQPDHADPIRNKQAPVLFDADTSSQERRGGTPGSRFLPSPNLDGMAADDSRPHSSHDSVDNLDSIRDSNLASPKRPTAEGPERLPAIESFKSLDGADSASSTSIVMSRMGEWRFDPTGPSVQYVPAGHADTLLVRALENAFAAETPGVPALTFHAQFTETALGGQCTSCHQMSTTRSGQPAWRAADVAATRRAFSKFSHRPHLLLSSCNECHDYSQSLPQNEMPIGKTLADFKPITKMVCVTCHQADRASQQCTHCHQYHRGRPEHRVALPAVPGVAEPIRMETGGGVSR